MPVSPLTFGVDSLFAESDVGVVCREADGRVVYANAAARQLLGLSLEDMQAGRTLAHKWTVVRDDGSPFQRADAPGDRARQTGRPVEDVLMGLVSPGDATRWLQVDAYPDVPPGAAPPHRVLLRVRDVTEQQLAKEQAAKWSRVFHQTELAFAVADPKTNTITDVNEAFASQRGYTREELIGQPVSLVYPLEAREVVDRRFATIDRARHYLFEAVHQRKDGSRFPVLMEISTITDHRDQTISRIAYAVDISERKRAEDALRAAESRLRLAVQAGNVGLWDWNLLTNELYFSPEWKRQIGHEEHEVGTSFDEWKDRVHPDDLQPTLEKVRAYIAHPVGLHEVVFRFRHKNGTYRWILAQGAVECDAQGRAVRMLGSHVDVTDRREAEVALLASRARLATALESMTDSVYISDASGAMVIANQAFATFHRFASLEECTLTLAEYPKFLECYLAESGEPLPLEQWLVPRALRGEHGANTELVMRRADTGETWVASYSFAPIRAHDGTIAGSVVVGRDVTERKRAEQELHQRNEELQRFTYTVSHDLKSPLVTIRTFLGYLDDDIKCGDAQRIASDVQFMERAAEKMSRLLDELLELSRVGRLVNAPEDVPVRDLVRDALDMVAGRIAARGVEVVVSTAPVIVRGDRRRLVELWQNLLDNAVKFMGEQPQPRIEIGTEAAGPETAFFVRDNGIGIDARHVSKLFGLFEKLDPSTEGVGVGLALVKRIVEVHGGRVWVESAGPGAGSTFRFTLAGTRHDHGGQAS